MNATDEDPLLRLENVDVHFDQEKGLIETMLGTDKAPVQAVDDVSVDIHKNDVVALVGESGCGKTTLGKTAVGLQRPTGGSVKYRGQDIWEAKDNSRSATIPYEEIRRSLQIIHQDPGSAMNPNRTVQASLEEPLIRWHEDLDAGDREARIFSMLEYVGMSPPSDYASRYPHQLSGGEKQRVALIRALLMQPDVILADEAVSALDVSLRIDMMELFLDLQDVFDTSFIFISHNLSNARYLAQKSGGRIGIMYLGKLVEIGTAEEVLRNPKHPYTKVLKWATVNLTPEDDTEEPPIRGIDIPDPANPPSGCRFHTRCPKAREICREVHPDLADESDPAHPVACFRRDETHEYWDSPPLAGSDDESPSETATGDD